MACPEDDREICCDIDCDLVQIALKDSTDGHTLLMEETRSNVAIGHQVMRQTASAKFRDVDPIEAAAVEAILNGVARND